MPRKLKTFQTSIGFFDLAVAAPSMKAALEAWGSRTNLFHQGFAREIDDPEIVAATMAKPGVVLQRPVGTTKAFREHAELPSGFDLNKPVRNDATKTKRKKGAAPKVDDKAARKVALAYEKEQRKREAERKRWETVQADLRERRGRKVRKAQAALDEAQREHDGRARTLEGQRAAIETKIRAEEERWKKLEERLRSAVRRAGD